MAVIIVTGGALAVLLAPVIIDLGTRNNRHVGECPVVIVTVKNAGGAVARYKNVRPAAIVKDERRYAERIMAIGRNAIRFRRNLFKPTGAEVVKQNNFRPRHPPRPAHPE